MAIDSAIFRGAGAYKSDVATFLGALRVTTPVGPAEPVMVAGDPQRKLAEMRLRDGVPAGAGLILKFGISPRQRRRPGYSIEPDPGRARMDISNAAPDLRHISAVE